VKIILVALSTLTILLACNLTTQQPAANIDTSPTAAPIQSTDEPISADLPETYTDNLLGFSVNYPAGWRADPNPGNHVMLFSYPEDSPITSPGSDGVPDTVTKIDFLVGHTGDPRTLEQEIADMEANSNGPGGRLMSYEAITLPSGISGYRIVVTGGRAGDTQVVTYLLQLGERKMYVTAYGNTAPFEHVVNTLRYTN